ncbi:hypothetical protein C1E23_10105 [Pseudoalteromonas phenolica]|uniref:GAPS4 PD-(D/E)XK nuclease domain-containing protein n=1 Tax=Pseudoalteromonas phenolica TaxID=161398 RepID=A0A4Q7IM72_9GAMM|nr:hypothetical protein [Pseudoalteromonas phenolica]RZQ53274.1 hypothetical protein C1E23_10105 [Pseudoalteromonas phenolica]
MAETGNIETLAKLVSKDIFQWFKWKACPLTDVNWDCVLDEHTNKKTHPSDVVYYYNEPYSGKTTYINTDLKSYKKGSISSTSISKALSSLALSIECANISPSWQEKFIVDETTFGIVKGLLFLFNHDDEFDKDLEEVINEIDFDKIGIPPSVSLTLFDPLKIKLLVDIAHDLRGLAV